MSGELLFHGGVYFSLPLVTSETTPKPPSKALPDGSLRISPSLSFFSTNRSRTACFSGGSPMKKSPRFPTDIPRSAALMIPDIAASKLSPPRRQPITSITKSNKPQILSRSKPSANKLSKNCILPTGNLAPATPDKKFAQIITNICSSSCICLNACSVAKDIKSLGCPSFPVAGSKLFGSITVPSFICFSW